VKDNAPVNVDAILQSILGKGAECFGIAAAVLQGERIIAQRYPARNVTYWRRCCLKYEYLKNRMHFC
jgi:hypothetical protein